MTPWVEAPTIELDMDLSLHDRYASHATVMHGTALQLLAALRSEITPAAKKAKYLAYLINWRTGGRFRAEARVLAKLGGVDWKELMLAAVSYEVVLSIFACSTMLLATADGPVLARNMDFWPEQALASASYQMISQRGHNNELTVAGWPGALGVVTGMSGRGFAIALNAVTSTEGINKLGYPVLLWIRRVLEKAQGFAEAVEMLKSKRLAAGALLSVVGTRNHERVVIERSPTRFALREAVADEPLAATNHYRQLDDNSGSLANMLTQTSCGRFDALLDFGRSSALVDPSDEALLYVLTDDKIEQEITAQHIIMRPAINEMKLFVPRRLLMS